MYWRGPERAGGGRRGVRGGGPAGRRATLLSRLRGRAAPVGLGVSPPGPLGGTRTLRLRRSRCTACGSTHVLVRTCLLLRRADTAEVIGWALLAKLSGAGHRWVGARLGRPPGSVRNWLRRFEKQSEKIRVQATRWAYRLDSNLGRIEAQGCAFGDALAALGHAVQAATSLLGQALCPWQVVSALTETRLLSPG